MKSIGLVTFWDNNYGSALQCYSLKKTIASLGYRCDLIEEKHTGKLEKYIRIIKKCIRIPCKTLLYPKFGKAYFELRKSAHLSQDSLSQKSRQDIHFFGLTELQPKELTRKSLKRIGSSDEYVAFITGSDQVWGGHFVEPTYGNFLEFAPRNKRISYAASFGSDAVSSYNKKRYKKGLKGIDRLAVREDSGIEIVKKLTGKTAVKMPDPTVLVSVEEWKQFSKNIQLDEEPYLLVHFLDKMSEKSVRAVKTIAKARNLKIICLGWKREEILSLENAFFADGGPREYISFIEHASCICTDSFHTTLFSLRFNKQFYTFPRCYAHRFHQSERITNLLRDTGCFDRYIKDEVMSYDSLPQYKVDCVNYFEVQCNVGLNYLRNAISDIDKTTINIPNLKEDNQCCGCGVCAEKCPQNAIQMVFNEKGYSVPKINIKKCVYCGICEKYCRKSIIKKEYEKKAYIAYSKDEDLLLRSASGGVFSSIAKSFILHGGAVYGAAMSHDGEKMYVAHRLATTMNELYPLLQSKYVQSNAVVCFEDIRERLLKLQPVLFSGTSCQVDALQRYLGKHYDNLYTIDLICHGVPGGKFFSDYVKFLEEKNNSSVVSFLFREKKDEKIEFVQNVRYSNGKEIKTKVENSDYYKLFFSEDSYRDCCYHCEYASIYKPADITVGDYFECQKDYPELYQGKNSLSKVNGLSCCISHNDNGDKLLSSFANNLNLIPVDLKKIQRSHNNLCYPSNPTDMREKMMNKYKMGGFKKIHRYNQCMNYVLFFPRLAKTLFENIFTRR